MNVDSEVLMLLIISIGKFMGNIKVYVFDFLM